MGKRELPIFPEFKWDGYCWITSALLPDWGGFQIRKGAYGIVSDKGVSDGIVDIVFAPEGRGDAPLAQNEISLVRWVIENQAAVYHAMIQYLFNEYPKIREQYIDCMYIGDEQVSQSFPKISTPEQLKKYVGVVSLFVHQLEKSGIPFVGIELGCAWDDEHGLGILLHGTKPLEIGLADTAFLLWMAEKYCRES